VYVRDGFPGQVLHVLPAPLVRQALLRPPTRRLLVTDAGYFPHAARHGRARRGGSAQAIAMLCSEGLGWVELDDRRHAVHAGDLLIIPPRVPHVYYADATRPWSIWWLHVAGDDVADLLAAVGLTRAHPVAPLVDEDRAFGLVEAVCAALGRDETMSSLTAAAGCAWNLLAQLAAERDGRSVRADDPVVRCQDYLREHLAADLTVSELAARAGLSTSHFSARFRTLTGSGVVEYVKRLRMARARGLLATTTASVAEIAGQVGYADPFYFSRQFSAVTGVSPREFRSSVQAEVQARPPDVAANP
jgi:AraC family transcriptional regulator, arabinose operon regulatory protein